MNKIVVLKFGGSSVADDEKLNIVAQKVIEYYKKVLEFSTFLFFFRF